MAEILKHLFFRCGWLPPVLLGAAACPDPGARYDEFAERVVDASDVRIDAPPGNFADISGEFLLSVAATVDPTKPVQFIAENTFMNNGDGTATVQVTLTPLDYEQRTEVPTRAMAPEVPVSSEGNFKFRMMEFQIDGRANSITGGPFTVDMTFDATIRSEDRFCGVLVDGSEITRPVVIPVDGSTWSAIRITPGTRGDDLPPIEAECPQELPDGGMPDAPPPIDASSVDGSPPDAAFPDA